MPPIIRPTTESLMQLSHAQRVDWMLSLSDTMEQGDGELDSSTMDKHLFHL